MTNYGNLGRIFICDGRIKNNKIKLKEISEEEFKVIVDELKDYVLYIEGHEESSYDDSDDDRAGCYSSSYKYGYYRDIDPINNSKHLILIDGKVRGVVFYVSDSRGDINYYEFFFDGSVSNRFKTGYSASHSSDYISVEKVSLVKKGENGESTNYSKVYFKKSERDTSI